MADKVRLVHPDLPGATYECHPDAVASWQDRGWRQASAAKSRSKKED